MTTTEIIEVLRAHEQGKPIQIRKLRETSFQDGTWYDVENPKWNFDDCDYRVKPEPRKPREWLVYLDDHGILKADPMGYSDKLFLVREVI